MQHTRLHLKNIQEYPNPQPPQPLVLLYMLHAYSSASASGKQCFKTLLSPLANTFLLVFLLYLSTQSFGV